MKIVRLSAENIKKLRAVEITPTGEVVEITGKNGQGKTSVLDAIWWALAGAKHIQSVPIRRGAEKARIRLDLGELVVERRFTESGSTLAVENTEGARYPSPQAMLDALLGALTFDPLAFVNQDARGQFETLRRIVPLAVDVDQLDGLNKGDFEERTEVGRQAKAKKAQADGILVAEGAPSEPIDVDTIKTRLAEAARTNTGIETERGRRQRERDRVQHLREAAEARRINAAQLRRDADELDTKAVAYEHEADAQTASLDALPPLAEPIDAVSVRRELDMAEIANAQVAALARKHALLDEAAKLEDRRAELTDAMEARTAEKAAAIAAAPMPVPGLGFGDGVVTFQGVPFDQSSSAEQLRVSVAIAMAANPKLRVIRIKEGALLDSDSMALIAAMAKERDYQVWIETVQASGPTAIHIEDGAVRGAEATPDTAA